jgi:prepilin-type N-terminal cleavage/methylation domain-containing protein
MNPFASRSAKRGFTLVELMVAIAVLSLLIILVSKIVSGASTIATYNNSHMDSNDQARLVFDRMALDFSRMLKRPDADIIFCKNTGTTSINDTMFFFSESAGDSEQLNGVATPWSAVRNNISLVGYRVNNDTTTSPNPTYGQLERLGKALPWDAASTGDNTNYSMVYLTYPQPGSTTTTPPSGVISTAYTNSTIVGAFPANAQSNNVSPVGTVGNYFNDGMDPGYNVLGSQVFRFEFSFLLKDGSQSDLPVIQTLSSNPNYPNGVPTYATTTTPPTGQKDANSSPIYFVGSRLYDTTNHVAYICTNAGVLGTPGYAVWKELGTQDISAIIITIATLDNSGRYFIKSTNNNDSSLIGTIAQQLPKWVGTSGQMNKTAADDLVNSWTTVINPATAGAQSKLASVVSGVPQNILSRIRVYQRFFYLNTH